MNENDCNDCRSRLKARYAERSQFIFDEESPLLDSSIKKIISFIKKLRNITHDQHAKLLVEMKTIKFRKYFDELLYSLMENSFSTNQNLFSFLSVLIEIFLRYPDFTPYFVTSITTQLVPCLPTGEDDATISGLLERKKFYMRLLTELFLFDVEGVGHRKIQSILLSFINARPANPNTFIPFISHWTSVFGNQIIPNNSHSLVVTFQRQELFQILLNYFDSCCSVLMVAYKKIQKMHSTMVEQSFNLGKIAEELSTTHTRATTAYEKLRMHLQIIADGLERKIPDLPVEIEKTASSIQFAMPSSTTNSPTSELIYEEESFILKNIPDIFKLLPSIQSEETKIVQFNEDEIDNIPQIDAMLDDVEAPALSTQDALYPLFNALQSVSSTESADKLATDFVTLEHKNKRKRLVTLINSIPNSRIDIVPYICRFLKIIYPIYPSIIENVIESLMGKFKFLIFRPETVIESRRKIATFIGYLTKLKIFPVNYSFWCIKVLVVDRFAQYNVDFACLLLMEMGRFMLNIPEVFFRVEELIEILRRKRRRLYLNVRQEIMINNALQSVTFFNNETIQEQVVKVREPRIDFFRNFFYHSLNRESYCSFFELLRDYVDWKDEVLVDYLLRKFLKVWKISFETLPLLAQLLADISKFNSEFVSKVIDAILEEVRVGLELNHFRENQRRISIARYIGLLFQANVIPAGVVFDTLWTILRFGYSKEDRFFQYENTLDTCSDCFRIYLLSVLLINSFSQRNNEGLTKSSSLNQCHSIFDTFQNRLQLELFMVYFNIYFLSKTAVGREVEFVVADCFNSLPIPMKHLDNRDFCIYASNVLGNGELFWEHFDKHFANFTATNVLMQQSNNVAAMDQSNQAANEDYSDECYEESSDDFDHQFKMLVNSSLSEGKSRQAQIGRKSFDFSIPLSRPGEHSIQSNNSNEVSLRFMVKKHNLKTQVKQISIPARNPLAVSVTKVVEEEKRKKMQFNQLVLREVKRQELDQS